MRKLIPLFFILVACSGSHNERRATTETTARAFFEMYKTRQDWQGFQDLFAEDLRFEDVIFRYTYDKPSFVAFYNWPDSLLKKHPDYPEVLVLEDLAFTDSTAIGRGHFTPFYYGNELHDDQEHMRFVIAMHVNEKGKISRQIDFIEYPPVFLKLAAESLLTDSLNQR